MAASGVVVESMSAQAAVTFTAMASDVTVRILDPGPDARQAMESVHELFRVIERTCTRFDDTSDLMRANANGRGWTQVHDQCRNVLHRAYQAYQSTDGAFDPRILESLQTLGYDRSWEHIDHDSGSLPTSKVTRGRWRPSFDDARGRVRVGPRPVDLGGIGKGVAVAEAMDLLIGHGSSILVEAGGDLAVRGAGPQGAHWLVHVENPLGGEQPAAVWKVTDTSIATSSIMRRHWRVGDRQVHHLIDPRTGMPARSELMSVTVVHPDAATAEVWTKVGFLAGRSGIRSLFDSEGIPAVWISDEGRVSYSRAATPLLAWKVSRVRA